MRFRESVAVHVTAVVPMGKVSPEDGEHVTVTEPWPSVTGGVSKFTPCRRRSPWRVRCPRRTTATGESATGGGGGGGGVGAVGLLHAAPKRQRQPPTRTQIAQYFTKPIDMNQPFYRTALSSRLDQVMTPRGRIHNTLV